MTSGGCADSRAEGDGRAGALLHFGAMHAPLLRPSLLVWLRTDSGAEGDRRAGALLLTHHGGRHRQGRPGVRVLRRQHRDVPGGAPLL